MKIILLLLFFCAVANAQPVPSSGLQKVVHGAEMTGGGTNPSPLGLTPCGSSGETWIWNGAGWNCGTTGGVTGTGTSGMVPVWNGTTSQTNSSISDSSGAVTIANANTTTAVVPLFAERTDTATLNDITKIDIGQNIAQGSIWTTTTNTGDLSGNLSFGTRWFNGTNYTNTDMVLDGSGLTVTNSLFVNGGVTLGDTSADHITWNAVGASALDMGTHQIHNVTDPSSAQDAATKNYVDTHAGITGTLTNGDLVAATGTGTVGNFAGSSPAACSAGQVVTRVTIGANGVVTPTCTAIGTAGGVTGTGTSGNLLMWSSPTAATDSPIAYDGTSLLSTSAAVSVARTGTGSAAANLVSVHRTLSAGTLSVQSLYALQDGTVDTTSGQINSTGLRGESKTTLFAGANPLVNYGVEGLASGSPTQNIAGHFVVSGANGSTDSRGVQIENTTTGGSLAYGLHILSTATATTNIAIKVGAVGGTTNRAFEASDGDVVLNSQSGTTTIDGATIILGGLSGSAGLLQLGVGGSREVRIIEKHNTQPSLSSCGTSPVMGVGSDLDFEFTTGSSATACTITFVTPWPNAPTCIVQAKVGANQASTTIGTVTTSQLPLTAVAASASYVVHCFGH